MPLLLELAVFRPFCVQFLWNYDEVSTLCDYYTSMIKCTFKIKLHWCLTYLSDSQSEFSILSQEFLLKNLDMMMWRGDNKDHNDKTFISKKEFNILSRWQCRLETLSKFNKWRPGLKVWMAKIRFIPMSSHWSSAVITHTGYL